MRSNNLTTSSYREQGRSETLHTYVSLQESPSSDLLFEQYLLETASNSSICLFIYYWSNPVLVLGNGQDVSAVDMSICHSERILVLRRRSGGTAVLHNRTLNVSLILPSCHAWAQSIRGLYTQFVSVVANALNLHGIAASPCDVIGGPCLTRSAICFESHTHDSLLINQKKVFGCAQRRLKNATLVHGTLLVGLDIPLQSRVFGVPERRIERAMTAVPDGLDPAAVAGDIVGAASARLNLTPVICFCNTPGPRGAPMDDSVGTIGHDWTIMKGMSW